MDMRRVVALAIVAGVLAVGAACSSGSGASPSTPVNSVAGATATSGAAADSGRTPPPAPGQPQGVALCEVGEANEAGESGESTGQESTETKIPCISVDVTDQALTLSATAANAGPLELIVKNSGSHEHQVFIQGPIQGNTKSLAPGKSESLRGRVPAGDYNVLAMKDGQPEAGLQAALKVQ